MTRTAPEPSETWIVVPAYREGPRLASVLERLLARYPNVVVIDDGSEDDTFAVACRAGARVLRHVVNRGQGAALQTGLDYARRRGAARVVTFDADGQHRVEDVERLVEPVRRGECDVTLGSRFLGAAPGIPPGRRAVLKLGVLFTRVFSRVRVTDTHNGLRCLSARALSCIRLEMDRMAHASELLDQLRLHDLRYREVAVHVDYTRESLDKGQSSWNSVRIAFQYLLGRIAR